MATELTVGLASFAALILVLAVTWFVRRENNKDFALMRLNAPLLATDALDRESFAAKDAEQGFSTCAACGFENFKRVRFCNICGAPLGDGVDKRARASKHESSNLLRDRKLRASKRKEWLRKIDVEGRLFWYRQNSVDTRFPGVVVRFEAIDDASSPVPGVGKTATLAVESQSTALVLLDASTADAARTPLGDTLDSSEHEREVVEHAALDFPAKYAVLTARSTAVLEPAQRQLVKLNIARTFALEQSFEYLSCMAPRHVRADLTIKYLKEPSAATSNLRRQWVVQLSDLLANPNTGLFVLVNKTEQTFYLNKHSRAALGDDHLTFFYAAGRLLGRGLLDGNLWGFHLATPLLKIILGQPLSFPDLAFFDPEEYKNLEWLVHNRVSKSLALDFSITERVGDETIVVDLIPNGRNVTVTDENKLEYLERRFRYTLFESVSSQLFAFLKGVYEVVPQDMLMTLDFEELDYILCGSDVIDAADWEFHSKYNECIHGHPCKRWFWKHVRKMSLEHKRRLLHFTTGLTRVPIGGFAALTNYSGRVAPFTIVGKELVVSRLIRGQPCFNQLQLPTYVKKKELESVLFGILDNYDYGE